MLRSRLRRTSRAQCLQALQPRFPELTATLVSEINARLFAVLTPQQRWQLSVRAPGPGPLDRLAVPSCEDA